MPSTITFYLCGVWFCVGLFTAAGWTLGQTIMNWIVSGIVAATQRKPAPTP